MGDPLPVVDPSIGALILYADVAETRVVTASSAPVTLYAGDATPSNMVFRAVAVPVAASVSRSYAVVLRAFGTLTKEAPPPPPAVVDRLLTLLGVGT